MRRVRDFLERPIADDDRRRAFAIAAAVLLIAAAGLSLTAEPADRPTEPSGRQPSARPDLHTEPAGEPPAGVLDIARSFLAGYLDHVYGSGDAGAIRGATDRLRDELADQPVRRPPAMRRQRPRVGRIDAQRLPDGWHVEAEIASANVSFPVAFVVARRSGGPLVTRLVED